MRLWQSLALLALFTWYGVVCTCLHARRRLCSQVRRQREADFFEVLVCSSEDGQVRESMVCSPSPSLKLQQHGVLSLGE